MVIRMGPSCRGPAPLLPPRPPRPHWHKWLEFWNYSNTKTLSLRVIRSLKEAFKEKAWNLFLSKYEAIVTLVGNWGEAPEWETLTQSVRLTGSAAGEAPLPPLWLEGTVTTFSHCWAQIRTPNRTKFYKRRETGNQRVWGHQFGAWKPCRGYYDLLLCSTLRFCRWGSSYKLRSVAYLLDMILLAKAIGVSALHGGVIVP